MKHGGLRHLWFLKLMASVSQGISGSFTVTRTSETTATCDMTIVMQGDSKVGIGTGTLTGTKL